MSVSDQHLALILRHLNRIDSDADKAQLEEWLAEKPENRQYFEEIARVWSAAESPLRHRVSADAAWNTFKAKHFSETVESGVVRKLFPTHLLKYAAAVLLLIASSTWYFNSTVSYNTAEGERLHLELRDGSKITLGENSQLEVPRAFGWFKRNMSLEGEATFDVTKNPDLPFRISTPQTQTQVLGTAFRLIARAEVNQLQLVEGKVAFWLSNGQDSTVLVAGEQVEFLQGALQKSSFGEEPNAAAWLRGRFEFNNTPLERVLKNLQDYYHFDLRWNGHRGQNCRFSGVFHGESMHVAVEELAQALGFQYQWVNNTLHIQSEACQP